MGEGGEGNPGGVGKLGGGVLGGVGAVVGAVGCEIGGEGLDTGAERRGGAEGCCETWLILVLSSEYFRSNSSTISASCDTKTKNFFVTAISVSTFWD
jgi:hypothetical protein